MHAHTGAPVRPWRHRPPPAHGAGLAVPTRRCASSSPNLRYHRRMSTQRPELMTLAEVAERLRVSRSTVSRMIDAGDVRTVRVARTLRVPTVDVDRIVAGLPPLEPPRDPLAVENEATWPPTPSMLGETEQDTQAADDRAAVEAAERASIVRAMTGKQS